jgi:hypothetical protein
VNFAGGHVWAGRQCRLLGDRQALRKVNFAVMNLRSIDVMVTRLCGLTSCHVITNIQMNVHAGIHMQVMNLRSIDSITTRL